MDKFYEIVKIATKASNYKGHFKRFVRLKARSDIIKVKKEVLQYINDMVYFDYDDIIDQCSTILECQRLLIFLSKDDLMNKAKFTTLSTVNSFTLTINECISSDKYYNNSASLFKDARIYRCNNTIFNVRKNDPNKIISVTSTTSDGDRYISEHEQRVHYDDLCSSKIMAFDGKKIFNNYKRDTAEMTADIVDKLISCLLR